jgi:GNAT superfamily N-acetyltransferase
MAFEFRVATMEDVPTIRELVAASVRSLQVEYTEAEREAAITTVFSVDTRLLGDGTYFIAAAKDGRLAGCGGWSRRKTLCGGDHQVGPVEPEMLDPAAESAKIRAIFVHPEFARMGLGSALLARAEDAARAEGFRRFEMGSTLTGVALYRLRGYREVERIAVPLGAGVSIRVVRMIKNAD